MTNRDNIPEHEVKAVAEALRWAEWGSLKGPNDVPGMWEYLAIAAIKALREAEK